MYRLISKEVDHRGGFGEGVLAFWDETRDIEYFHEDDFKLLIQFVDFLDTGLSGIWHVEPNGKEYYLVDILGRQRIGRTKSELAVMCERGYWFDGDFHQGIGKSVLRRICSPLIMLRYHVYALVDTDGYLWYLNSNGVSQICLGDICRYVTFRSIRISNYDTIYGFDDSLEFVYPYPDCFKRAICNDPRVKIGNKYKNFFLNTDVIIV